MVASAVSKTLTGPTMLACLDDADQLLKFYFLAWPTAGPTVRSFYHFTQKSVTTIVDITVNIDVNIDDVSVNV